MALKEELLNLLRTDAEARSEARKEILTEELLSMPARLEALAAAQQRTEERLGALTLRVEALAAAQQRTEERLEALTAAQQRTEERLAALIQVVEGIAREVAGLQDWRRGEQGRREGERYERDTVRHAYAIFGGGRAAGERPEDLDRLRRALDPLVVASPGVAEADDPFLSDVLWLKGDRVAVVEVSRQVDRSDVERAARRARTLAFAGVKALGIVIGRDWASDDAEGAAREHAVEWRVGEDTSGGYLELRRLPPV